MVTARGYDAFAGFYQRHWSSHYHPWAVAMIGETLLSRLRAGARVVDVCCGTGIIAGELSRRGFDVTGVDFSANMLRYARENSPGSRFVQADARCFAFRAVFDGALCTFDGLNHILSGEDLLLMFGNIRQSLVPGGVFVADLNLEESYTRDWNNESATVTDEYACFIRGRYDPGERLGRTQVTIFESRDGHWERSDATMLQRYHPTDLVTALLREAGFGFVEAHEPAGDFGTGTSFGETRAVLLAVNA